MEKIRFVSGILLSSKDPEKLAKFYCELLNLPLVKTEHGGTQTHYECDIGDVHFAIHPVYQGQPNPVNTSARIGFAVFSLNKVQETLKTYEVRYYGPRSADFGNVISIIDPDGNPVDIYEHSEGHYQGIEKRRKTSDLVSDWKESLQPPYKQGT